MRVFAFLVLLTVVEVGVAFVLAASSAKAPLLIALALAKATLVAMYYMHLRFEGRVLRLIAIFPLILSIVLALAPSFDVLARR
jgi:cytochrome c oxidase subunit 4